MSGRAGLHAGRRRRRCRRARGRADARLGRVDAPARGPGRPRRVRVRGRDPARVPRAGDRVLDRRRGHEDRDRRGRWAGYDTIGHRPRRDVRRRRRVHAAPSRSRSSTTSRSGGWTRSRSRTLVAGVAEGCRQAGCALVGGETAEHPGLMEPDEFDLAGFCIGIGERDRLLDGTAARAGDAIVGLASSGPPRERLLAGPGARRASTTSTCAGRTRRCCGGCWATRRGPAAGAPSPRTSCATLGEVLLTPTRIYARDVLAIRDGARGRGRRRPRHGAHHGRRAAGQRAAGAARRRSARGSTRGTWPMPSVMRLLGALGGLEDDELRATFNGGLGMVVVVPGGGRGTHGGRWRAARGVPAWVVGEVVEARRDRRRAVRGGAS